MFSLTNDMLIFEWFIFIITYLAGKSIAYILNL